MSWKNNNNGRRGKRSRASRSCLSKPLKLQFFFRNDKSVQMLTFWRCSCTVWTDSWLTRTSMHLFAISNIHGSLVAIVKACLTWEPFWQIEKVWIRMCYTSQNLPNCVAYAILQYQRAGSRLPSSKRYKMDFSTTKTITIWQIASIGQSLMVTDILLANHWPWIWEILVWKVKLTWNIWLLPT